MNDPIFPNCLDAFKARHEASLASGAATSVCGASSRGESSTPTQEFPLAAWLQPPPTPTLEWQEVEVRVTEVMDQVHDLHLQTVQEMGFIWEIDQAFAKSLMVEFFRLRAITGDDLSEILQTWQANMEAAMDKLLRDLDVATQTSTTLPSKNAAVGVALHQFREATRLRMAFPLTQLDEAREEMGKFMWSHLEELRSQQETRNLIGELSSRITDHRGRVHQLLHSEPLRHPEFVPLVLVGMAADRPLESNFFWVFWRDCWEVSALLPPGKATLPHHPGKLLAARGPQLCMRPSRRLSRRRWRHPEPLGCLNVWIFVTRRISLKDKDVKYHRSSRTRSSFLIWLRRCSM